MGRLGIWLIAAALVLTGCKGLGTTVAPPWGPEARKTPMRSDLINLTHLNFLVEPMQVPGRDLALVHIYSEAPRYDWVDAGSEGIGCVDDVARAAIVYLHYYQETGDKQALAQARQLLNFVMYLQTDDGEYYNFVRDNKGTINKTGGTSYKSWSWWAARGQWALAEGYGLFRSIDATYATELQRVYRKGEQALQTHLGRYGQYDSLHGVKTPAWLLDGGSDLSAMALYGLSSYYAAEPNAQTAELMNKLGEGVATYQVGTFTEYPFGAQPSMIGSTALWHAWGSHQVAALARAGRLLKRSDWIETARFTADSFFQYLLTTDQVNELAVSTKRSGQIAYGTDMLVSGFAELAQATGDKSYERAAGLAASWFFGNNIAETPMYDPGTGRGFDGIGGANEFMVNRNSGAESTIEALLALQSVVHNPVAAKYLTYRENQRSFASVVEAEDGKPVAGSPEYGRRDWTGEASFSNGRYYALPPQAAVEVPLQVQEEGDYHLYLAHMRQAAPKQSGSTDMPAVRATAAPQIDGDLGDAAWAAAPVLSVNRPDQLLRGAAAWPGPDKESHTVRLLWDDDYLYVGAEVRDPEFRQEDVGPGVWRGDVLWLYMDSQGDKNRVDVKLTLTQTPKGLQVWDWKAGGFLPGAKLGFTQHAGGYIFEAALPIKVLGNLAPKAGKQVGLEIGRGVTGGGFMDWTGHDPDAAENLAPLIFYTSPPPKVNSTASGSQGPDDVAVTVQVGEHVYTLVEATSPDRDYLWLDRVTGLPLHLKPGTYPVRLTGAGKNPQRSSVVDALWLVPILQRKVFEGPKGQRLELIRHWDAAFTEWKE
jgi:hypothetical protein